PFQNDSQDSSNVYLINGLMVALIDNLHQIQDLQVTSRTTIERYRAVSHTIPELAEELGVSYFVEGSGQKIGDKILLTLRLIDGQADTLIWAKRYQRETTDIFQLQSEVSTSIAGEIEAFITPEEQQRLQLPPTDNLVAYDYYLQGLEQIKRENRDDLILGIASLQKAIAEDPQFAHPHAYLAISYYFLDLYQTDKKHVEDINTLADKALLLDPKLNESLIGKALYYMQAGQYELSIQFFDKVLRNDPGSGWVHNLLSTIYSVHQPNTEHYLRHALQGINYAVAGQDSNTISFAYLHLGNALAQNGFLAEAVPFLEKSLQYQASNLFAETLAIYVQLGLNNDFALAYQRFQSLLAKEPQFLSSLHETAKLALYQRKYEESWEYYERFLAIRQQAGLDVYKGEDINIAFVLQQLGRNTEAERYRARYFEFIQTEEPAYQDLGFAAYYTAIGEKAKAIEALKAFAQRENYQYWLILYIDRDPMFESLETEPDYAKAIQLIKDNFWRQHQKMRTELQEEGLI
ncbi:MAG: AraC family transcriptional regulator, partial [Bacteroidota bacterium]